MPWKMFFICLLFETVPGLVLARTVTVKLLLFKFSANVVRLRVVIDDL